MEGWVGMVGCKVVGCKDRGGRVGGWDVGLEWIGW